MNQFKEAKLRDKAIFLLENANDKEFWKMVEFCFGSWLSTEMLERLKNWDINLVEDFIKEFSNKRSKN